MYFAPISQATKYNYLDDKFQAAYKWLAETDPRWQLSYLRGRDR